MNIVIFGGAGFIGTNLVFKLIENNNIIVVDNLQTSSLDNVNLFVNHPNYQFIEADITQDMTAIEHVIDDVDWVVNLACPASPPKYQINPLHTLRTSLAIDNICSFALSRNAKLLQASTSEVYGNPITHVQKEEYSGNVNCIGERSCYDEGKRVAETFLYEYRKLGLDCKIIRIFNTYGPYMDINDGRVITNFIKQITNNEDITVYGNGLQTRSFQYVDDLIEGMLKVMESNEFGPYNIGNPEEYTIIEVAQKIKEKFPESTSKIIYSDLPIDDPIQRCPDISKMRIKFNWKPIVKLNEGLDKLIHYFGYNIPNNNQLTFQ